MDLRTRLSVGVVLGLGLSTVGVNIARFLYIPGLGTWEDSTCESLCQCMFIFSFGQRLMLRGKITPFQ